MQYCSKEITEKDMLEYKMGGKTMEFKNFKEASDSGKVFYQLFYYDRREEYSGYRECEYYSTRVEAENRKREMEQVNKQMFNDMLDIYSVWGVTKDNYWDNYIWNEKIKDKYLDTLNDYGRRLFRYDKNAVGYCFIDIYERDLVQEEIDEQAEYEEDDYEDGPYGGAFRDEDDYNNWRFGPGFVED